MAEAPSEGRLQRELRSYYGPLLPHWDRSLQDRGDLDFWRRAGSRRRDGAALELGAGSGRVTEVLAEDGPVVGLDLNPEAVRRARRRLAGREGVHLLVADMRTFRLDRRFGLVVAANDPFSHLRTDRGRDRALGRVAAHLAGEGRFLLDALWFPEDWVEEAAEPGGKVVHQEAGGDGEGPALRIRQRWRCRPADRTCVAEFRMEGGREPVSSVFRGRWWTPEELEERLARAGLQVRRRWGDYEGSDWEPDASHLVVEAVHA